MTDHNLRASQMAHELLEQTLAAPERPGVSVTSDPAAFDAILYGDGDETPIDGPVRHARRRPRWGLFDSARLGLILGIVVILVGEFFGWWPR